MPRSLHRASLLTLLLAIPLALGLAQGVPPVLANTPKCAGPYSTPGVIACIVPKGVSAVTITAIGGAGGVGGSGSAIGQGDSVTATFAIGAGQVLAAGETVYVTVASNGIDAYSGGGGGTGGGGAGAAGAAGSGGGGGASDVRTCSLTSCPPPLTAANDSRILVGGGGGGGGSGAAGGQGGNAGLSGQNAPGESGGGGAGTATAGGIGGNGVGGGSNGVGSNGGRGVGGAGGINGINGGVGGGGGGGYFGGGGGGANVNGSGGGGGSDFVQAGGTGITEASTLSAPSVSFSFTAGAETTTTALTATQNPSDQGQPVTFTATVLCPGNTSLDGDTVRFFDGLNQIGHSTLNASGVTSFTISTLSVGAHAIYAVYHGDNNCAASTSNTLSRDVLSTAGGVQLLSSANPSSAGQPVTFTATINCPGYVPTGTVTFNDGSTVLGSASVSRSGQASLRVTTLTAGSHAITAAYSGDANCAAGTSAPLTQTVRSFGLGFGLGG